MKPTIISKKASKWVDRGESAVPTMRRLLAHFFDRFTPEDQEWLDEHAQTILGMVAADATEVHIAGLLRGIVREIGGAAGEVALDRRIRLDFFRSRVESDPVAQPVEQRTFNP